ncbi:uncharacterized protein LOC131318735 isoform X2 [Rhododendron vialii]|uniref:uncharacterized protein LOC131318735 isoform X2 n=1 Tax=Rhododendron vialii TaxID=182163 RepID=UPI00266051CB|nr:uncharacterized protein LOC131318735 isoform X2 [Rhododendron vialii]
MEILQLIDISSEDDFLIASHLDDNLRDFRLSVSLENIDENKDLKLIRNTSSQGAENAADIPKQREQKLLVSESMDPGRASHVRKSLAWDSAFFTSAGVLDPEELCIINRGFEKSEAHLVHKIRQDQRKWRSVDIQYTLKSDGFCFETNQSTEGDLFEDVRASIQRSSIMSNVFKSDCKSGVGEACKQKARYLKKVDDVSQNRHATRNGESNLFSCKPPKILRIMNPVSAGHTKILLGADPIKMEKKTATSRSGQGLEVSKRSGSSTSFCSTSSMISPKPSSSIPVTASNDATASCSPSFRFSSTSKRKTDSTNTRLAATGSTNKTPPLRCSPGGKSGLRNLSSNQYSFASPVNSFDGWSLESSSASARRRSKCLETGFCTNRGACLSNVGTQQLDLQSHSHDQLFGHQESQQTKLLTRCIDEVLETGNALAESRRFRPSGLRVPSPKMGFFDEEKSPVPSVSGGLQLHLRAQSVLSNTNGTANGETLGKPQPASVIAEKGNMKSRSKQTGVIMARNTTQSQEQEESSPQVSSISATVKNCPGKASKVQCYICPQLCRENCSKSKEVSDGGYDTRKLGLNSGLKEERKITDSILENGMRRDNKRRVCLRVNMIHPSKDENLDHHLVYHGDINRSKKEYAKDSFASLEDHVNGLSRYFEAVDLNRDTVIELSGKNKGRCNPIFGHSFTDMETNAVEVIPSTRTPLADRNSVCTGAESFGFTTG